jgi:hypothetical protein
MNKSVFEILREKEDADRFTRVAKIHLDKTLMSIKKNTEGSVGEKFVEKFISSFKKTSSPIFVNLDHNVSERHLDESERIVKELEKIVESTAEHVSGYKMNFQSMLTFLIAKRPNFVQDVKEICKAKTNVEPVVWLDQKLGDIPNTNFQAADILYKLGFDAVHALPQIGPDCAGAVGTIEKVSDFLIFHPSYPTFSSCSQIVNHHKVIPH